MLSVLVLLQIVVVGWWAWLQTMSLHTSQWNFAFNGVYGIVYLLGGLYGLLRSIKLGGAHSTVGRALALIASGTLAYGIGQFIWLAYNLILHTDTPYPSYADAFFVLLTPLVGIGFYEILRMYRTFLTRRLMIELLIVFLIVVGIIVFVITPPDLSSNLDIMTRFFNLYYPLGDSLLLSLALITFRTGGGKFDASILMFSAGMLLLSVGDTLFTYRNDHNLYWNGDITDLLFALAGFFLFLGMIRTVSSFTK